MHPVRRDRVGAHACARNGRLIAHWLRRLLGASLVAASTAAAAAAGWVMLLKDTPAQKFQDDDLRMFLEAARDALNAEGPPKPVEWSNPKNRTGGSFLVIGESVREGMPCKRLRFSTYAPGYPNPPRSSTTWTACKNAEGRWKLADAK